MQTNPQPETILIQLTTEKQQIDYIEKNKDAIRSYFNANKLNIAFILKIAKSSLVQEKMINCIEPSIVLACHHIERAVSAIQDDNIKLEFFIQITQNIKQLIREDFYNLYKLLQLIQSFNDIRLQKQLISCLDNEVALDLVSVEFIADEFCSHHQSLMEYFSAYLINALNHNNKTIESEQQAIRKFLNANTEIVSENVELVDNMELEPLLPKDLETLIDELSVSTDEIAQLSFIEQFQQQLNEKIKENPDYLCTLFMLFKHDNIRRKIIDCLDIAEIKVFSRDIAKILHELNNNDTQVSFMQKIQANIMPYEPDNCAYGSLFVLLKTYKTYAIQKSLLIYALSNPDNFQFNQIIGANQLVSNQSYSILSVINTNVKRELRADLATFIAKIINNKPDFSFFDLRTLLQNIDKRLNQEIFQHMHWQQFSQVTLLDIKFELEKWPNDLKEKYHQENSDLLKIMFNKFTDNTFSEPILKLQNSQPIAAPLPKVETNMNKKVVALLDVDNTLSIGGAVYNDDGSVESIPDSALNHNLITALQHADIKNVYLFTDMSLGRKTNMFERQALVKILEDKGFTVKGVITPADCAWNKDEDQLAQLHSFLIPEGQSHFFHQVKQWDAQKMQAKKELLNNNAVYNNLKASTENSNPDNLGKAYKDVLEEINAERKKQLTLKGDAGKLFTECLATEQDLSDHKGIMYKYFLDNVHHDITTCYLFDDKPEVLESSKKIHDASNSAIELISIQVNHRSKENNSEKYFARKMKPFDQRYYETILLAQRLLDACNNYADHLAEEIGKLAADKRKILVDAKLILEPALNTALNYRFENEANGVQYHQISKNRLEQLRIKIDAFEVKLLEKDQAQTTILTKSRNTACSRFFKEIAAIFMSIRYGWQGSHERFFGPKSTEGYKQIQYIANEKKLCDESENYSNRVHFG